MQDEIKLEHLMCKSNPEMQQIFEFAKSAGKRIFISSDMYLPIKVIREILTENGYSGYEKLLLSSDTMRPKATGEMYEDLIAATGVPANQIVHIGDNRYTDFEIAKQCGITAYCYETITESYGNRLNSTYFGVLNAYNNVSVIPSILQGLIIRHTAKQNGEAYWKEFGYKYAGIIAYGYMQWLKSQVDAAGIDHVYFMLRDGYIFKRVFDAMYSDKDTKEIFGSRSMYLLPGMDNYEDIQQHITGLHRQGLTYSECYNRLGVEDDNLLRLYKTSFPNQNAVIFDDQDFKEIDSFLKENQSYLKAASKEKRQTILNYFDKIGLLNEKSAIVDLGWKGSMLKGVTKICELENRKCDIEGFFLGTHAFDSTGINAKGYALNNGKPDDAYPVKSLLDYGLTIAVLELMFSAPHPSVLGVDEKNEKFSPVYQKICSEEQVRIDISEEILAGVNEFVQDINPIMKEFPLEINANDALIPLEYIATSITRYDMWHISQVCYFPGVGDDDTCYPISKNGHVKCGISFPRPGSADADADTILRVKKAAAECAIECVPIDNFGNVLSDSLAEDKARGKLENPDFVISTHFETHRAVDSFYYHALWNSPEAMLNSDYYNRASQNCLMCDDYLIYDKSSMSNHLRSILVNCPRTLEGATPLLPSLPESAVREINFNDTKIFYRSTNCSETDIEAASREELLKLLDKSHVLRIYEHNLGDDSSLVNELNKCGICLIISSDSDKRAGIVTSQVFEACAAGAVIISDKNSVMQEMFNDDVLFIDYNRNDTKDACRQIIEKYQWIISHRKEAIQLAERAQKKFLGKYSLNYLLKNLVGRHPSRIRTIAANLYAQNESSTVLVSYVCNTLSVEQAKQWITVVINNVNNQIYRNIVPVAVVDQTIANILKDFCKQKYPAMNIVSMPIFNAYGSRQMTDGQAFTYVRKTFYHDYFMFTCVDETWYFDHVTTLIRSMKNEHAIGAYSGQLFVDYNGNRQIANYDVLNIKSLTEFRFKDSVSNQEIIPYPGAFMFDALCHNYVPDFMFDCLDGREYMGYLHIMLFKQKMAMAFSRRMTLLMKENESSHSVISAGQERRFILGLSQYDRVQNVESSNNSVSLSQMLDAFPIKLYLKLRYYRFKLRKAKQGSAKQKKYNEKYQNVSTLYNQFWNAK